MSVSREDVMAIAALARIRLDDDRVDDMASELNGILQHMDVLQKASVPSASEESARAMPLRADLVAPVALSVAREEFAPLMRDGFFLVPRLATHDDLGTGG